MTMMTDFDADMPTTRIIYCWWTTTLISYATTSSSTIDGEKFSGWKMSKSMSAIAIKKPPHEVFHRNGWIQYYQQYWVCLKRTACIKAAISLSASQSRSLALLVCSPACRRFVCFRDWNYVLVPFAPTKNSPPASLLPTNNRSRIYACMHAYRSYCTWTIRTRGTIAIIILPWRAIFGFSMAPRRILRSTYVRRLCTYVRGKLNYSCALALPGPDTFGSAMIFMIPQAST
jgi:hypothetical protein